MVSWGRQAIPRLGLVALGWSAGLACSGAKFTGSEPGGEAGGTVGTGGKGGSGAGGKGGTGGSGGTGGGTSGTGGSAGSAGAAGCTSGFVVCGGECVDPSNDLDHCGVTTGCGDGLGSSGVVCAFGETCEQESIFADPVATPDLMNLDSPLFADLNGDGTLDVIGGGGTVEMTQVVITALGLGDGTFQTPAALVHVAARTSSSPSFAVGDMNGDGQLDVVIALNEPDGVGVLLGNGDGTLQTELGYRVGDLTPASVALGDFDGNGSLDVVVGSSQGSLGILLGQGDGTLGAATVPSLDYVVEFVRAGDLNGDGRPDVVTAGDTLTDQRGAVGVLFGDGAGGFTLPADPETTTLLGSISDRRASRPWLGRVNGDEHLDFIVWWSSAAHEFLGNGDGGFSAGPVVSDTAAVRSFQSGDFNRDGWTDHLLVHDNNVVVKLSDPLGQVSNLFSETLWNANASEAAIGDLDGDGYLDVLLVLLNEDVVVYRGVGGEPYRCVGQ